MIDISGIHKLLNLSSVHASLKMTEMLKTKCVAIKSLFKNPILTLCFTRVE